MAEEAVAPPLISIIITNFNYAAYVGDAIRSALQQDYRHVECIVVDDGSSDGSRGVIEQFEGIMAIFQANSGQTGAAMAGLAQARGQVVVFLDADDGLARDACTRLAAIYAPDIALYQFRLEQRDAEGRAIGVLPSEAFLVREHREAVLRHGSFPSAPTSGNGFAASHARAMFAKLSKADHRRFFDGYLIFSAPFSGRVVALDAVLGSYRVHGRNVSRPAMTRQALRHNVGNAFWQRSGIALNAGREPEGWTDAKRYLSPYHLRNGMILQKVEGRSPLPQSGLISLFGALLHKAVSAPRLGLYRRVRLIGTGIFVLLMPRWVLAVMVPEDEA